MIEGIHILNSTEIMDIPTWAAWLIFGGMLAALFGILIMLAAKKDVVVCIFGIVGMIGVCTFFCGLSFNPEEPTGRYRYEVTIDPSVTFSELYEKYDVIEQRGEIWVLEEKEK